MSVKVKLHEGEAFDSLMKRFKRQVNDAGILDECKKREFHLKKSLARQAKAKRARIKAARRK